LQNSGRMSGLPVRERTQTGNATLSPFLRSKRRCPAVRKACMGCNMHGGSMDRNFSSDKKAVGRLDARKGGAQALRANGPNQMGQSGEADRRS